MLIRGIKHSCRTALIHNPKYFLLDHKKMEDLQKKLFSDREKTWMLKAKFFLKETKYTIVQGSKDLWNDTKWFINLHKKKKSKQFTGYELSQNQRILIDMLKFIPYSVILLVPFAELSLPFLLWLFPNAIPSFYLFDTAYDKLIEKYENIQFQAHKVLIDKLLDVLSNKFQKQPSQLSKYESINQSYFEIVDDLGQYLNYENFNSDDLIKVLEFMGGGDFITGTGIINKVVNLFTLNIPRLIYKILRFLYGKILRKNLGPYKDPFFIRGNFQILKLNFFPFEFFKKQFLLFQINRKFKFLYQQDIAFEKYGMADIIGSNIKEFARERGLPVLSCYVTLGNVIKNDWVKFATNEKYKSNNNAKLWYSVIMYNFLKESSRDQN